MTDASKQLSMLPDEAKTKSVLQDWVMCLPLRYQGTLLTGIRGCDFASKRFELNDKRELITVPTPERGLVAFLRFMVMNPADPREIDIPGSFFQSKPPFHWRPSEFGHYPLHWFSHLMHCYEVCAYHHPDIGTRGYALSVYKRFVENLHLNIETAEQLHERLTEDRMARNNVVS